MPEQSVTLSRRAFVVASMVAATFPTVACSQEAGEGPQDPQASPPLASPIAMTVHKDPTCPCCDGWAKLASAGGFVVTVIKEPNMGMVKQRLGVPDREWSCHTAEVGDLVFEGHVPIEHIKQVVAEQPEKLRGLAVAGMPRGTPGMEMPDGSKDAYNVIAFYKDGQTRVFARGNVR